MISDREAMIAAIREAVREALDHVGLDMIRSSEFFGTESEGKVTLTCWHTNMPSVNIWEPWIDRQGQRCRSYATYCPACAEDASLAMVEQIEEIEAENRELRRELWNISSMEKSHHEQ